MCGGGGGGGGGIEIFMHNVIIRGTRAIEEGGRVGGGTGEIKR